MFEFLQKSLIAGRQLYLGLGDLIIGKHDGTVRNISVGIKQTGEGLSQHGLTGAGLSYDCKRLMLINIQ